jgi:sulfur carrier protein
VNVVANGRMRQSPEGATVDAFIRSLDLDPRFVIVEYNGKPLARKQYDNTSLSDGDRIELVKAVAGG